MINKINAQTISTVFNPVVNSLITFVLLILADEHLDLAHRIEFLGIATLFASGLIILCLFVFIRLGLINSPDIPDRKQRSFPLTVAAIALFIGFLTLSLTHAPNIIQGLMWCYATETLMVAIISYWWKISIHTASMACSLIALTDQFGAIVFPFYSLLVLVGEARIVLRRHTRAQVIAGTLLGIVLTAIQLQFFKLV
ncbi:phosphatase PAP2 family protein [Tolypothrix bouteillei VB521301_2]|uniref:Phosphoesterase PA-phosphatase n=1 Tax=Tolypothrix bouteillei VB521301 TaxID=1479485 RepID=A0A0C1QR84_9CYAN